MSTTVLSPFVTRIRPSRTRSLCQPNGGTEGRTNLNVPQTILEEFDYEHDEIIERLHDLQHGFQLEIDTACHVHNSE